MAQLVGVLKEILEVLRGIQGEISSLRQAIRTSG